MRELRKRVRASRPFDEDEEEGLLKKAAAGDAASLDRLVAAHLGLVIRLAEAREHQGLSAADLVQEGSLGLVEAVQLFAVSGQENFANFAERKIGEQMDAALAAESAAVREGELLVAAASDYERTEQLLQRELKRPATDREIAEKLEWTVERTRYVAQVVADARRRHDEELLAFVDPDAVDLDGTVDGE